MKILMENWRQKLDEMEGRPLESPEDHEYRKKVHQIKEFIDSLGLSLEQQDELLLDLRIMFDHESGPL